MQHSAVLEVLGRERAHVRRDVDERLPADSAHAAEGARDGEAAGPVAERGDGVVDAGDVEDRRDRLDALAWAAEQVGARVGEDELRGGDRARAQFRLQALQRQAVEFGLRGACV